MKPEQGALQPGWVRPPGLNLPHGSRLCPNDLSADCTPAPTAVILGAGRRAIARPPTRLPMTLAASVYCVTRNPTVACEA